MCPSIFSSWCKYHQKILPERLQRAVSRTVLFYWVKITICVMAKVKSNKAVSGYLPGLQFC